MIPVSLSMHELEVQSFLSERDNEQYNAALESIIHEGEAGGKQRAFLQLERKDMQHYRV